MGERPVVQGMCFVQGPGHWVDTGLELAQPSLPRAPQLCSVPSRVTQPV